VRVAIGQLWQETNTFNPIPTTRADFEAFGVLRGPEMLERMATTNELGGFIQSRAPGRSGPTSSAWHGCRRGPAARRRMKRLPGCAARLWMR
jgi:hypothetical protein